MDKALEKINELTKELDNLLQQLSKIKKDQDKKSSAKYLYQRGQDFLEGKKAMLNSDKVDLEYKQQNIKKWKLQTIFKTAMFLLLFSIGTIVLNLGIPSHYLLVNLIIGGFSIPSSFILGECGNYYYNRKFLKKHKLEDIEKEIVENNKLLELNIQSQNDIRDELIEIKNTEVTLEKNIKTLRVEIENIKKVRKDIIDEFIKDNVELYDLLNAGYNTFTEEKAKQNIIKNSNK